MQFALQLMDLWDNERPKRMRRLHPEIRAWRVSRSSVSGVMVNSKWNLIQYKMQGILPASCAFCLLFTVRGPGRDWGCQPLGGRFHPQLCPLCCECRRGWKAEAVLALSSPGRCEETGVAAVGSLGGQDYLMEEGMMGSRMKRILLTRGQPSIQREAVGNSAKEDLVILQFSTFLLLGVEYKCIRFLKMPQFEISRKAHPPPHKPSSSICTRMSDIHQEETGRIKCNIVANL